MLFGPLENMDDLLDYPFLKDYGEMISLRDGLEMVGEDLIEVDYEIDNNNDGSKTMHRFVAWSEENVIFVNYDSSLCKVPRNPNT